MVIGWAGVKLTSGELALFFVLFMLSAAAQCLFFRVWARRESRALVTRLRCFPSCICFYSGLDGNLSSSHGENAFDSCPACSLGVGLCVMFEAVELLKRGPMGYSTIVLTGTMVVSRT